MQQVNKSKEWKVGYTEKLVRKTKKTLCVEEQRFLVRRYLLFFENIYFKLLLSISKTLLLFLE